MNTTNKILSEISAGELMDKITILEIKKIKISDSAKKIIINNCDHNTAPILKKRGKLKPLINSFFQTNI